MGLSVGEVARLLGGDINPQAITNLFYQRKLDVRRCPIVGGRRIIPLDYVPAIKDALRKAGKLPAAEEAEAAESLASIDVEAHYLRLQEDGGE
jgi:hypothetical protein